MNGKRHFNTVKITEKCPYTKEIVEVQVQSIKTNGINQTLYRICDKSVFCKYGKCGYKPEDE